MFKPVVGIVVWRRGLRTPLGDPEVLHALSDAYVRSIAAAGVTPLLIPNARPSDEVGAILDRVDGLVLSGGGDVDPSTYGAPNERSYDCDPVVDQWEIALLKRAEARRIPTLCICRGHQILNVAHGGTLRQEILAEGTVHAPLSGKSGEEILEAKHPVSLTPGGLLSEIYGTTRLDVNTIHHQAIETVGDGLTVEAVSPDGIIEAVTTTSPSWWCVGVQWHPERNDGVDTPLFETFARVAR